MGKRFKIKNFFESEEIQKSYDAGNYEDAVLKSRIYLESWLIEYIYALLYPSQDDYCEQNKQFVKERFYDMFFQISWLHENRYISPKDFSNLNKIRGFCDDVLRKGDVFKVVSPERLDQYIETTVYYCYRFKNLTQETIEIPK